MYINELNKESLGHLGHIGHGCRCRITQIPLKKFHFFVDNIDMLTIIISVKSLESNSLGFSKSLAGVGLSVTTTALSLMSVTNPRPLFLKAGD
jgi:hypothetical protein